MKLILQRVSRASVTIDGGACRTVGPGLMILAGFCEGDNDKVAALMAEKAVNLRIFDDENGQMNRSLLNVGGGCLVVSNFTLYANCRKGRRPSFIDAAPPAQSLPLYECFVAAVQAAGAAVQTGEFGANMQVELVNDGPVTIVLDSAEILPKV